jgi:hypothetical protein
MGRSFPTRTMNDWFSSTISSSRPSLEFTAVGEDEVDERGGEDRRLINEGARLDGGGTGMGEGERELGS